MCRLFLIRQPTGSMATLVASAGIAAALSLGPTPAYAIPSPELVVGSFVSLSQLFALASAVLGGGALYATSRGRRGGAPNGVSRGLLIAATGAFFMLVVSAALNVHQYLDRENERQARLESTLSRPVGTPQGTYDPGVRDLILAQQNRHPRRISTEEAARLLSAHDGEIGRYILLDVRERAERVTGSLQGATAVRLPDLQNANIDFAGKKVVLICRDGNRSSEVAEVMFKAGIDAVFVVGGLEKWMVEGREGLGKSGGDTELNAVPDYPNRKTLLDTPQVKVLVENEKALLVDVRRPAGFAASHVPGAVNLDLRSATTAALRAQIATLPKRAVVLPCYDRVGCFYAEVLGYELFRAGYDVRGRYTVPWEYFVSRARPPYVEAWLAERSKGLWNSAVDYLAGVLLWISKGTGAVLAILLLAVVSRLLVLPFSLKAERDQIRSRLAADELAELKSRFKDDPVRRGKAIREFYKRHGLTPLRNLLALAFLPVMAVALLAVQQVAIASNASFLWIPSLPQQDPLLVLPVVFAVLITLYVDLAFVTKTRHRLIVWLVVMPAMIATGLIFSAAGNLYLVGSAFLLLLQRLWVTGTFAALVKAMCRRGLPAGVISLDQPFELADKGNKAYRLAQMRAAGLPVPDGVLLPPDFLTTLFDNSPQERRRQLGKIWNRLGRQRLAVRSSASGEDSSDKSFAGVFESVINVERQDLEAAIATVRASFGATRTGSYLGQAGGGSVLIQRMVHAEYAGVLFTRDPSAGALAMVELVQGTAEDLVSGKAQPKTCRFGRVTKTPFGKSDAAIDLQPLLHLGDAVERLFGGPQDIEWTYLDGQFRLIQSRDITRKIAGNADTVALQTDLSRVADSARGAAPDEIVFGKNEMSEMLPRPTPLSLSLMESLWESGGSVDYAARELGLTYRVSEGAQLLTTILGRLYVDKREEKARALAIGALAARRLLRDADRIERSVRESFLPRFLAETRLLEVADLKELTTAELLAEVLRLRDRFVHDTHVSADVVNIAASVYLDRARQGLEAAGVEPSALLGHIPETFENRALAELSAAPSSSRRRILLKNFGHRATLDYELTEPRYREDLNILERAIAAREHGKGQGSHQMPALGKSLARIVDVARRFQTLKEDAKHHSLRELAVLRRALVALDHRLGFEGNIFYLTFDEMRILTEEGAAEWRETARARRAHVASLRNATPLPSTLAVRDIEAASAGDFSDAHELADTIRGTRVSGSRVVEGRARVVSENDAEIGSPLKGFRDGDIVIAPMVNPAWLPYFSRAGGFVSEVGGWLSHPAILAREYDVAMVVGTRGIAGIADGSMLRIHLDGRIEVIAKDQAVQAA
jgi:rhodanese-related sulfurtransferase/membrane protein insertase Oxa1/YidC/SpoIIIJ/phosphohistidine swiveling domain-containing protein